MDKSISHSISIIDEETGEVKSQQVVVQKNRRQTNIASGWNMVYKIGYDKVMEVITSKLEHQIFQAIRDSNEDKSFILKFNQTKLAKEKHTTVNTVAKVVKKLRDIDFIRKDGSVYKLNPNIWVPPYTSTDLIVKAQEEWHTLEH